MNPYLIIGQVIGIIAAVIMVISFQFKENKKLFAAHVCSALLFSLHFMFLGIGGQSGAFAGMAQNIGVLAFKIVLLLSEKFSKLQNTFILTILCTYSAVTAAITYDGGVTTLLPMIACILSMGAMWTKKPDFIRIEQFALTSPLWLVFNISAFSVSGIFTECFNMLSIVIYYVRTKLIKKAARKGGGEGAENQ